MRVISTHRCLCSAIMHTRYVASSIIAQMMNNGDCREQVPFL